MKAAALALLAALVFAGGLLTGGERRAPAVEPVRLRPAAPGAPVAAVVPVGVRVVPRPVHVVRTAPAHPAPAAPAKPAAHGAGKDQPRPGAGRGHRHHHGHGQRHAAGRGR